MELENKINKLEAEIQRLKKLRRKDMEAQGYRFASDDLDAEPYGRWSSSITSSFIAALGG
jgi:hypothetical protein